jgi:hypothetical protein
VELASDPWLAVRTTVLEQQDWELALAACAALIALLLARGRRLVIAATMGVAAAALVGLSVVARVPEAVALPFIGLATISCWLTMLTARDRTKPLVDRDPRRVTAFAIGAVAVLAAVVVVVRAVQVSDVSSRRGEQIDHAFTRLREVDPHGVFLIVGASLPTEGADPLRDFADLPDIKWVQLGWPIFAPTFEERMRGYGIGRDVLAAPLRNRHIYFVMPAPANELYEAYVLQHHHVRVHLREVADLGFAYGSHPVVWEVQSVAS